VVAGTLWPYDRLDRHEVYARGAQQRAVRCGAGRAEVSTPALRARPILMTWAWNSMSRQRSASSFPRRQRVQRVMQAHKLTPHTPPKAEKPMKKAIRGTAGETTRRRLVPVDRRDALAHVGRRVAAMVNPRHICSLVGVGGHTLYPSLWAPPNAA